MTANHLGPYKKTLTSSYVEYAMIPSAAEGLVEGPGIRLITQRSQVQILPPLQFQARNLWIPSLKAFEGRRST